MTAVQILAAAAIIAVAVAAGLIAHPIFFVILVLLVGVIFL